MSETQALLARITALRQRLEQSREQSRQVAASASVLAPEWLSGSVEALEQRVQADLEHDRDVDHAVGTVTAAAPARSAVQCLTSRARLVLEQGRDLLHQLRDLADAFAPPYPEPAEPGTPAAAYLFDFADPLAQCYRETAAIADTALRMVPHFPETATGQLHLCDGLEGILSVVSRRLDTLSAAVAQHDRQRGLLQSLTETLTAVASAQLGELRPFLELADSILQETQEGEPLRFLPCDPTQPVRFVAAHSLTTARVLARIGRDDPELKGRLREAVVAALLHDVGMLRVPAEVLASAEPLSEEQRRQVQAHCQIGASLVEPFAVETAL